MIVLDDEDTRLPMCLKNTLRLLWERFQLTVAQFKDSEKYPNKFIFTDDYYTKARAIFEIAL